jgi:hypothetical protein
VFIMDESAPSFSLEAPLYSKQLAHGARLNVLSKAGWGCWRSLPRPEPSAPALAAPSLEGVHIQCLSPAAEQSPQGPLDYVARLGQQLVMGVATGHKLQPRLDPLLRWPVPQHWSAPQAAAVPYVYAMVSWTSRVGGELAAPPAWNTVFLKITAKSHTERIV